MIKETIEQVTGITFEQIRDKCHKPELVDARSIYAYHARNAGGKTQEIGRDINRDHSVVSTLYQRYVDLYRFNPAFRAKAEKVENILKKQITMGIHQKNMETSAHNLWVVIQHADTPIDVEHHECRDSAHACAIITEWLTRHPDKYVNIFIMNDAERDRFLKTIKTR